MKHTIKRGETIIGWITCPSESGAPVFGLEVLAESVVDNAIEDNQFTSFSHAEDVLHYAWEEHCKATGVALEPRVIKVEESNEQYAQRIQNEREAEEAAYYASLEEGHREQGMIIGDEQLVEVFGGEPDGAAPERVEPDTTDSADDDLPF